MGANTALYHRKIAPGGQSFDSAKESFKDLQKEGWVDSPAKINRNPWGTDEEHIKKIYLRYLSQEIPGIDEVSNATKNQHCYIWGTVISIAYGHKGQVYDSVRTGGYYDVSAHAAVSLKSLDNRHKARITTWLINQRRPAYSVQIQSGLNLC